MSTERYEALQSNIVCEECEERRYTLRWLDERDVNVGVIWLRQFGLEATIHAPRDFV